MEPSRRVSTRLAISRAGADVGGIVLVGTSDVVDPPAAEVDFEVNQHLVDGSESINPSLHLFVAFDESSMERAMLLKTGILMLFHVMFFVREVFFDVAIEKSEHLFDDDEIVLSSSESIQQGVDLFEEMLVLGIEFLIAYRHRSIPSELYIHNTYD